MPLGATAHPSFAASPRRAAPAPAASGTALLARAGCVLPASLDRDQIAEALAGLVVPELADACAVDLACDAGETRRVRVEGDPSLCGALPEAATPGGETPWRRVLPLTAEGETLGALTLARAQGPWADEAWAVAEAVAALASRALRNARLYARAQAAARMRDEVLGVVAHDLRNPLMAVSMYAHLLQDAGLAAEQDGWTGTILRSVDRMNTLIQDLLDVSALDEGRLRVKPAATAVAPLLREAAQMLERQADARGLHLACHGDPGLPPVLADRDRVLQVLSNLLGNAIKFSPAGAAVELRAEAGDAEVEISVRDHGRGIAPDDLPRVFERFWQGAGSRGGAGLGLAIARGLVESHGGRMRARSAPGEGSTFSFTLPVSPHAPLPEEAAPAGSAGRRGARIRVLVVDDHPAIRRGLRELLRRRPGLLVVGEAATAAEALERTAELSPDVVLMDLNLPGGGLEATRAIARRHPATRVLILTAEPDDGRVGAAVEAGARGYLRKSADPSALVAALRGVHGNTLVLDAGLRGWAAGGEAGGSAALPTTAAAVRVLALEAAGFGTGEIATRLELSRGVVRQLRARGMCALGLSTRVELVRHALREGWLGVEP